MNEFVGINVEDISIVAEKFEQESFDFMNPCREYDGFVLITDGHGYAVNGNGERFSVESGDMLILNRNDSYEIHCQSDCSYITSAYSLSFDCGEEYANRLPFVVRLSNKQISRVREICNVWQSREWDSYTLCRIGIIKLYLELIRQTVKVQNADNDILCATEYIHKNFKKNFSGEDISSACSVSASYLRTKFLKQTGQTITEYRDRLRISAAKEMLESGIFSVTEISNELGYCDVYHFSKVFKKHTGVSPRGYMH